MNFKEAMQEINTQSNTSTNSVSFKDAMNQVNPGYIKARGVNEAQKAVDAYNQSQQGFHPFEAVKKFLGFGQTLPEVPNAPNLYNVERNAQVMQNEANAPSNWAGRAGNAIAPVYEHPIQTAANVGQALTFGTANLLSDAVEAVHYNLGSIAKGLQTAQDISTGGITYGLRKGMEKLGVKQPEIKGGSDMIDELNQKAIDSRQQIFNTINSRTDITPQHKSELIKKITDASQQVVKASDIYKFANKDEGQVFGEAIGTLADYLTFGTASKALETAIAKGGVMPVLKFFASKEGVKFLAEQSVKGLAQFGLGGLGMGMQDKQSGQDLSNTIVRTGVTGAVAQPALVGAGSVLGVLLKKSLGKKLLPEVVKEAETKFGKLSAGEVKTLETHLAEGVDKKIALEDIAAQRAIEKPAVTEVAKTTETATPGVPVKEAQIINPDIYKEKANDFNPANHEIYSSMAKQDYANALQTNPNPTVKFTMGGSGSGKSEVVVPYLKQNFDGVILDGTGSNYKSFAGKLDQAMAAGKKVEIGASLPDIERAWTFVQKRYLRSGRPVPLDNFIQMHMGFVDTLKKTMSEYPEAKITLFRSGVGEIKAITDKNKIAEILNSVKYKEAELKKLLSDVSPVKAVSRDLKKNINNVVDEINKGGITYDVLKNKSFGGEKAYSVSPYPERTKIFKGKIKSSDILQYVKDNLDLLVQRNHTLGGWYDSESKQLYLDVAGVTKDLEKAKKMGKDFNQKAIFDLKNFKEIPTGGTGEATKGLPSIKSRIASLTGKAENPNVSKIISKTEPRPKELTYKPTTGTSQLAKTVKSKAIKDKMIYGFDRNFRELPEYDKVINKEQVVKATDFVLNNYDEAVKVAMGESKPPAGLLARDVYVAMNEHATATKDIEMIRRLAVESKLVGESTGMGQELQALARLNPDSALSKITEVAKARQKTVEGKLKGMSINKAKGKIVSDIQGEIKRVAPSKQTWAQFIEEIKCK